MYKPTNYVIKNLRQKHFVRVYSSNSKKPESTSNKEDVSSKEKQIDKGPRKREH